MWKLMVSVFPLLKLSCLFHCLLDKTLFPSGTQPGISSQVRTMENDTVVSINLAYDFKCWRMSFQSSVSDSFNQYFVHCQLKGVFLQADTANSEKERSLLVNISELQSRYAHLCTNDVTYNSNGKYRRNSYGSFTTPYHL